MKGPRSVSNDRTVRSVAVAALLLVLSVILWGAVLAWYGPQGSVGYPAARAIAVSVWFALGVPVMVLGLLVTARPGRRLLGAVCVTVGMGSVLPSVVADLYGVGGGSPVGAIVCVIVAALGGVCRVVAILFLPLWLVPPPTRWLRRVRLTITLGAGGYFLGSEVLWALSLPMVWNVPNPLATTLLSPWATSHVALFETAEYAVSGAASAVVAVGLVVAARRLPGSRDLIFLAVLHPLVCVQLLLSQLLRSETLIRTSMVSGSILWVVAIGVGIARTGVWRVERSSRHRIAQACVLTLVAVPVLGAVSLLWIWLPAVRNTVMCAAIACALALGWAMRPAMAWAATRVEHAFYGPRAHLHDAVRALAVRLQQAPHPREVPEQICRSAVEDVGVSGATVSVVTRVGPRILASAGARPTESVESFPLRYHGQTVGTLDIVRNGSGTPPERDSGLLALLADQAGPALAALRLTEEAQAARERLVLTREEERRRLRREIHDGLGPLLASVRLRIDTAQAHCPPGDPGADQLYLALQGVSEALVEVRRITAGLTPAALVERGLPAAVHDLVSRLDHPGLLISIDTSTAPPALPPAVETAAYRIVAEALTNAVRHSRARHVHVVLATEADTLTVTVTDDGTGPDPDSRAGTGIASMTERAEEIGGSCTLTAMPSGTVVHACLPATPLAEKDPHQ